jgi:phosphoribosylglycinamide formyltransferase 1
LKPSLVVLASGSGSNFQSIIDAVLAGTLHASIAGLIASKPGIGALERATNAGIDSVVIRPGSNDSEPSFSESLIKQLSDWQTDLILLAGYLAKIPHDVVSKYPNRILNIHPSLLPKYGGKGFYGINVHRTVLENREIESGCTVHLVNEAFDEGPILAQTKVPVHPNDTPENLAARILVQEHILYPKTIQSYLNQLAL